ncbi:MAG: hypothetical protein ACI4RO_00490, partial [Candidatus Scatosoma sp.]
MDYVFIIISMLGFTLQFILMQIYEKQIKQTLTTGILLIVIENLVGAAFFFAINGGCIAVSGEALLLAALLAIVLIAYNLLSLRALALGNLAIYSMFMMLGGMALPFAYGVVFLKETISVCKFIGLFALTGFIVLQAVSAKPDKGAEMQSGEVKGKKAQRTGYVLCCLAVFIINGLTGVISKAHQVGKNAVDEKSFIVLYCLITMLLGLCIFGADTAIEQKKGRKLEWRQTLKAKPLGISALLGIV